MSASLLIEQGLNGARLGIMLFLMAAGLTLVFGVVNLAHGSLYMLGACFAAIVQLRTGSFLLAVPPRPSSTGEEGNSRWRRHGEACVEPARARYNCPQER